MFDYYAGSMQFNFRTYGGKTKLAILNFGTKVVHSLQHMFSLLPHFLYPVDTFCGGATLSQGQKLLSIYKDPYGVFCIDSAMWDPISPLNNAPANWLSADLHDRESTGSSSDTEDTEVL